MRLFVPLLGLYLFSSSLLALPCAGPFNDSPNDKIERECNELGQVIHLKRFLVSNGLLSLEEWFEQDRVVEAKYYRDGEPFTLSRFHYPSPLATYFIRTDYILPQMLISNRETIEKLNGENYTLSRLFVDESYLPTHEVFYNREGQLLKRNILNSKGEMEKMVLFHYDNIDDKKPQSFVVQDAKGRQIAIYDRHHAFDFDEVYQSFSESERERRRSHFEEHDRIVVSVVDSGVDIFHPDLAYKMYVNSEDPVDGVDNDGNGLIDDWMGWAEPDKIGLPHESITPNEKGVPNSHGTHVASILSRDLEGIAILPFVGDYGEASFMNKMSEEFGPKKVQFANMSFSFPHYRTQLIEKSTIQALQNLIANNSQTLFVVAAGNDGKELSSSVFQARFPAVLTYDHVFTIGAIDNDVLKEKDMPHYQMADYSNYSDVAVDILAPGTKVNGASLGGGDIRHTGTSMATPYALREALALKLKYPELTGVEIKHLMMRSAYIPDLANPFPVRSGGMIFPRRAMETARVYLDKKISIDEAAIKVRSNNEFILSGERIDEEYLNQLRELWQKRGI